MSWYEATSFDSISLCRSLVDPETLEKFDSVLRNHGLEKLCREEAAIPTQINQREALAELQWLKTLLQNVHERSVKLGIHIKKRQSDGAPASPAPHANGLSQGTSNESNGCKKKEVEPSAEGGIEIAPPSLKPPPTPTLTQPATTSWRERRAERKTQPEKDQPSPREQKKAVALQRPLPYPETASQTRALRKKRPRGSMLDLPKPARATQKQAHSQLPAQKQQKPAASQPPEDKWCFCRSGSSGLMVACDNDTCPFEWFHADCVGLSQVPKSKWYCPRCRPKINKLDRAKQRKR